MGFNINFSPVGTLVSLASAAGQAQAAQRTQTLLAAQYQHQDDLRLRTQQLQQAGQQNAQEMQLRERAMQLQEAASARIANTPTGYQQMQDRLALELQGRKTLRQEANQEKQDQQNQELEALEVLKSAGGVDEQEYNRTKFGIMTGTTGAALQKTINPTVPKASSAEMHREASDRADAATLLEDLNTKIQQTPLGSPERAALRGRESEVLLSASDRWGAEWRKQPMAYNYAAAARQLAKPKKVTPDRKAWAFSSDKRLLKDGRLYFDPKTGDTLGVWSTSKNGFVPEAVQPVEE